MPKFVIAVIPDADKSHRVFQAWERCGVSGVTILESVGLHKMRQIGAQRDDLPLFPSLRRLLEGEEYHHRTAFTVVDDDFDIERLIDETEQAIGGDFDSHNSGIIFVLPVLQVAGLRKTRNRT